MTCCELSCISVLVNSTFQNTNTHIHTHTHTHSHSLTIKGRFPTVAWILQPNLFSHFLVLLGSFFVFWQLLYFPPYTSAVAVSTNVALPDRLTLVQNIYQGTPISTVAESAESPSVTAASTQAGFFVSQDKDKTPKTIETRSNAMLNSSFSQHQAELHRDEAPLSYDMATAYPLVRVGGGSEPA